MTAERTDEQLMCGYREGEAEAFRLLYRRHGPRIYSFLRRRIGRREDLDEVYQLVFSKLHQSRFGYDPAYPFGQWLFVITKTVLLDHWRRSGRRPEEIGREQDFALEERVAPESPGILEESDRAPQVAAALTALPEEQRQAVQWRVMDELSYAEIAAKTSRTETSVRQLVSRGLKRLRDRIGTGGSGS